VDTAGKREVNSDLINTRSSEALMQLWAKIEMERSTTVSLYFYGYNLWDEASDENWNIQGGLSLFFVSV